MEHRTDAALESPCPLRQRPVEREICNARSSGFNDTRREGRRSEGAARGMRWRDGGTSPRLERPSAPSVLWDTAHATATLKTTQRPVRPLPLIESKAFLDCECRYSSRRYISPPPTNGSRCTQMTMNACMHGNEQFAEKYVASCSCWFILLPFYFSCLN